MKVCVAVWVVVAIFMAPACKAQNASGEWVSKTAAIMGTRVHVELHATDQQRGAELADLVLAEMHRIDRTFSTHKPESELSQLNAHATAGWFDVSLEMVELLTKARQISELTEGAFDITYASVGRYYDYRAGKAPDEATVAQAVQAIDYRHVEIDPAQNRVRYSHPAVYVDLGGIAKGHAVDRSIDILSATGVTQASVSAGGDSRILGDRHGQPWTVGVKHPREADKMSVLLPLVDTAVSTSGDYERYFEKDGVRYHHILDPNTGTAATGSMSVTVLGPDATFTDGMSTSIFVLGPEAGLALANRLPGIDAIIINDVGELLYSADLTGLD